ncbi:hypothetical protein [Cerasicoccus fimbriatus]|uniref:hypothetical protein n=1 Tax=Cerasicoccus fimbriatus TaxID=3014554 RepID=UPI0022B497DC|nr:hypothetical protein [Cerasicoccus sp. TK19100]
MTDFENIRALEAKHGEIGAKVIYANFINPDGTAPEDYQEYAKLWGHPSHKASIAAYGLAA